MIAALPQQLYSAAQSRELDRQISKQQALTANDLISRAASAALDLTQQLWPEAFHLVIVCGTGNNGGDGFELARQAHEARLKVTVYELALPEKLSPEAQITRTALLKTGLVILPFKETLVAGDVLIDAIFGTGLSRDIAGHYAHAIAAINSQSAPILSLDVPSGINVDTGAILGCAVHATATLTFLSICKGLLTGEANDYCGALYFDDLHTSAINIEPDAYLLNYETNIIPALPHRKENSHKGSFGHSLIIGGNHGMSGAVRIAAEACARIGSGLISIGTHPDHSHIINISRPELMCHALSYDHEATTLIDNASALCIGTGLGKDQWAQDLFNQVIASDKPMVIDADGLNLLALSPQKKTNHVLTPHPGEAARLLNCSTTDIQADRFSAVTELQQRYGGVVVLKGAGTLIYDGDQMDVCPYGNPGMASGGMGDALAGIITGLIAQKFSLAMATRIGVVVHSLAADLAVEQQGERGLLAMDLLPYVRQLINAKV